MNSLDEFYTYLYPFCELRDAGFLLVTNTHYRYDKCKLCDWWFDFHENMSMKDVVEHFRTKHDGVFEMAAFIGNEVGNG